MNTDIQAGIWHKYADKEGIIWLALDAPETATNTLTNEVLAALATELDSLETTSPRGVVFCSAKKSGFIAGADINAFKQEMSAQQIYQMITEVQALFSRIENLPFPTVAMIHGFCLGGGMEMALACDYRLAQDDANTSLGLPEVKLGIHPGYGGSVRLIELLGVIPAMTLMLNGKVLTARQALKAGLVDEITADRQLKRAAKHLIMTTPPKCHSSWFHRLLSHSWLRPATAYLLRKQVLKRINPEHYPAPLALIDCWKIRPPSRASYFLAEAESVASLLVTETAQNLVRLFFLRNRLKAFAKTPDLTVKQVHVIGAGVMGGDIAAWCALQGMNVTLQDQSAERIAPAMARAYKLFTYKLKLPHLVQAAMDRLSPDPAANGVRKADVVIEAIFENLEAKQALYKQIEPQLAETAILATNTSSLSLQSLSTCLQQPERLVGLHFFNPVAKMQLVEVVSAEQTADIWTKRAMAFVGQINRLPLPVKSSAGFLINRILMPYLLEAVEMQKEGIAIQQIDKSATYFGMPMGPIELADTVGLDICLSVAGILSAELNIAVPDNLQKMVDAGRLGRKSGRGFYEYDNKGQKKISRQKRQNADLSAADITQRLILRLLNECVSCLDESIVQDKDLLDAGMVFGTGFAPFRGGPMRYLEQRGVNDIHQQLTLFSERYGNRFEPQAGWRVLL